MANNANTDIYDRAVDRAAMIRLYEKRVGKKVEEIIDGHKTTVADLIVLSKFEGKKGEQFRKDLNKEILDTYDNIHTVTKRSLLDLAVDQLTFTENSLKSSLGDVWKTQRPIHRVSEDIVLNRPLYKDVTLSQGWSGVATAEKKRIEALIRKGISEGLSEEDIAKLVRKSATFEISKFQSLGLVRTAITSVYTQTDHEVFKANAKALQGWQYVAVLDSRTTPLCASRDGHVYPIGDTIHLPPAHFNCRSTTVPIVKSYNQLGELESISQIRKRNFQELSPKQIAYYDGQSPLRESYDEWLRRQPTDVQLRHLGDLDKVRLYQEGQLTVDKFNDNGRSVSVSELRQLTEGYTPANDTQKFAFAKQKLDAIKLGATRPDEFYGNKELTNNLKEYFILQSRELDGTLSYTNYRGQLLHTKKSTRLSVLNNPPRDDQLRYNPITNTYDDVRLYQPSMATFQSRMELIDQAENLKDIDKKFIKDFIASLEDSMSLNERSVVADNLRIIIGRFRDNKEPWSNFKAVVQSQMKFDVMNISEHIETQIRKDSDILKKLLIEQYIDPILGEVQLKDLSENLVENIKAKNVWEDRTLPGIAHRLRKFVDLQVLPLKIKSRLDDRSIELFYLKFAKRLSLAEYPDRDQLAVKLGQDLYTAANWRGSRNEWWKLGMKLLDDAADKGIYNLKTYGVQKRRMRSKLSGQYFGPKYDTFSVYVEIVDPKIRDYVKLTRKVELGLRVPRSGTKNKLYFRPGYKTYFTGANYDTRIPITSTSSFSDFPTEFVDDDLVEALNWTNEAKYKVDGEFYNFIKNLMYFRDDKGKAAYYDSLNEYKKHMLSRGDTYERFKAMDYLSQNNLSFSNLPFLDHRARIYDRGLIGPQSGEVFRPFLSTASEKPFSIESFYNLQDQIGAFLGGSSDVLEYRFNSLSILGRQKVAEHWRKDLIQIGDWMRRGKPQDIRNVLNSKFLSHIDGEEQGKVFRFALEMSRLNEFLKGDFTPKSLSKLSEYKTALALEQDASSSGAQIIALTTRNKQLAEIANVVPTDQKKRLYDEIAAATFNDPRFKQLNKKLGLTEKDLRKAAKMQNMVTLYGAGERTAMLNVESKLAKVLEKDTDVLVVKASERDAVLNEISARMARFEKWDPVTYEELKALRQDIKDVFNKGLNPGDDLMEQLWFLDSKTRDYVEKLSKNYDKIVTPGDFSTIASIMAENLRNQAPVLKDFTKFLGRLAEEFFLTAKPKNAKLDVYDTLMLAVRGERKKGKRPPEWLTRILGIKNEAVREKLIRRMPGYDPNGTLADIIEGVKLPEHRRTGYKVGDYSIFSEDIIKGFEILYPNKMPKKWTNVPWVNFDGKIIEQNFTQSFQERLAYKNEKGEWINNILTVDQKTDPTLWEQLRNKSGKINDIADTSKARTSYAVNGNHSNDATLVKQFHLWGKRNNIPTSTIHDAFFTNVTDMLKGREALRQIYSKALKSNSIKDTLDEMLARGMPKEVYNRYLNEAIDIGLIPVAGRSRIGGKILTEDDILKDSDILKRIPSDFKSNNYWYGVG